MKKTIASVAFSLVLLSSTAMAAERAGDAALGALSGAVVLGPIGAVAGAVIGYTAGPSISNSWGMNRSSAPRHARRAANPDAHVPGGRQSTCAQSVCAQRSSGSSSGRPSAAVHHHGFHSAASPATRVRQGADFGPVPRLSFP